MNKFWDKVEKCDHKNLEPNYYKNVPCGTPYCYGRETHCLDCGVYITECGCGFNNGMSGWPDRRHRRLWRKKEQVYVSKNVSNN